VGEKGSNQEVDVHEVEVADVHEAEVVVDLQHVRRSVRYSKVQNFYVLRCTV